MCIFNGEVFSGEQQEVVRTALWIGDCFVFTTDLNRLNYYVGGEIVTIAHLDRPLYLVLRKTIHIFCVFGFYLFKLAAFRFFFV